MKNRILTLLALVVALGAIWFGWSAYRASRKLVTLDVRDMPVRQACRLIERQTWETIHVAKPVDGKVTLRVKDAPLEEVLGIMAEQVYARSLAVYPLYTSRSSLRRLEQIALGEETDLTGWKAWGNRTVGGGPFGEILRRQNSLVTLQLLDKEVEFAALALNRFARAQVVPEDGTTNSVSLFLRNATLPEAAAMLADKARRKWTLFYTLQPGPMGRRGPLGALVAANGDTNLPPMAAFLSQMRGGNATNSSNALPASGPGMFFAGGDRQKQMEALQSTMSPEERKRMEALRDLSPEQRQQQMAELFQSGEMQARMQQRMVEMLQNSTPEQRVERTQFIIEMRQRFGVGN